MESSHPPFPFDQQGLVALKFLSADNRYLRTSDELELGPAVRYAAEIDGVRAYVVIRALNSVTSALLVFHSGNEWHLHEVLVHHGGLLSRVRCSASPG